MRLAVSATSRIPSETANSIQVLMACQGLVDAGHELTLAFPGTVTPDFDAIRAQYGLHCDVEFELIMVIILELDVLNVILLFFIVFNEVLLRLMLKFW